MKNVVLASALAMCASVAMADFPLYIPGFDDQPLTAVVEGVDAQSRTTYVIGPGTLRSADDDPAGILNSATLIEGPSEAHLVYIETAIPLSLSEDCSINGGTAVCTVHASAEGSPASSEIVTETTSAILVQGTNTFTGTTGTGTPAGNTGTSNTQASSSPGPGSSPSTGPTSTGSTSSSDAAPTGGNGNGAGRVETSVFLSLGVVGVVSAFFL